MRYFATLVLIVFAFASQSFAGENTDNLKGRWVLAIPESEKLIYSYATSLFDDEDKQVIQEYVDSSIEEFKPVTIEMYGERLRLIHEGEGWSEEIKIESYVGNEDGWETWVLSSFPAVLRARGKLLFLDSFSKDDLTWIPIMFRR